MKPSCGPYRKLPILSNNERRNTVGSSSKNNPGDAPFYALSGVILRLHLLLEYVGGHIEQLQLKLILKENRSFHIYYLSFFLVIVVLYCTNFKLIFHAIQTK